MAVSTKGMPLGEKFICYNAGPGKTQNNTGTLDLDPPPLLGNNRNRGVLMLNSLTRNLLGKFVFLTLMGVSSHAAPIEVTVFFGTGVTLGPSETQGAGGLFNFSGAGTTTVSDTVAPGISLGVTAGSCGAPTCVVYGTGQGIGSWGTTQSTGVDLQVQGNATEFLSFTFSVPVIIRGMVLQSIESSGGGDGARFSRILPSGAIIFESNDLSSPGFGFYDAASETSYIFALGAFGSQFQLTGADDDDDFFVRAITFEYDGPDTAAVPEPSSCGLLGLGLGLLAVLKRRKVLWSAKRTFEL